MNKIVLLIVSLFSLLMTAQDKEKQVIPQISISGEGKVKIAPDQATITLGISNSGKDPKEVKLANDIVIDKVLKYVKNAGIATSDYQTSQMNLYKSFDYEKKKHFYNATQTVTIKMRDFSKYNLFMQEILDTGINQIDGVSFSSSKMELLESEARKKAMLNAKKKADDYVSVLNNQKIGKAILITDSSYVNYPQPVMYAKSGDVVEQMGAVRETLAIGEIEIQSNVQVTFLLE